MAPDVAPWISEPVFCLTSDIDWASDASVRFFHESIYNADFPISYFLTHDSEYLSTLRNHEVEFGIHPNFLPGSSHGELFDEGMNTCLAYMRPPSSFAAMNTLMSTIPSLSCSISAANSIEPMHVNGY